MFRPGAFFKGLGGFFSRHLPETLSCVSIGLIVVTGVCAGKGALEANKRIAEYEAKVETTELSTREVIQVAAPCYVPAVLAGLGAATCIIFSNKISLGQLAAAATATATAEKALAENREAIQAVFNKKGLQKVDQYINENHAKEYFSSKTPIYETSHGSVLCCESYLTGLKFKASAEWVKKCMNDYNAGLNGGEDPNMNDFIQLLLPLLDASQLPAVGENLRMPIDPITRRPKLMDLQFDSTLTDDDNVMLMFTQRNVPVSRPAYDW